MGNSDGSDHVGAGVPKQSDSVGDPEHQERGAGSRWRAQLGNPVHQSDTRYRYICMVMMCKAAAAIMCILVAPVIAQSTSGVRLSWCTAVHPDLLWMGRVRHQLGWRPDRYNRRCDFAPRLIPTHFLIRPPGDFSICSCTFQGVAV